MKRTFWVTGYVGEGAKRMLEDLRLQEQVKLIDKVIENKVIRFLYYRCSQATGQFRRLRFLKKLFYPWYTVLRLPHETDTEDCILFINSGFCRELDIHVVEYLKRKNSNRKLILYIVDPMISFNSEEHRSIIEKMDAVYSINREDCARYGFHYYPLVYSVKKETSAEKGGSSEATESDLYYLGSGTDRTEELTAICRKCREKNVRTEFHVLGDSCEKQEGIIWHQTAVPYEENIACFMHSNCILEVMHKQFDNPTQRYSEAVVYNKKLLTNNKKTAEFDFYDPRYIQIFDSPEEIDMDFVKRKEPVDYGYQGEFSPIYLIRKIDADLDGQAGKGLV